MFQVGDKVKVNSPGAHFDGYTGTITARRSTSMHLILFDITFLVLTRNPRYNYETIGIGFKPWELERPEEKNAA